MNFFIGSSTENPKNQWEFLYSNSTQTETLDFKFLLLYRNMKEDKMYHIDLRVQQFSLEKLPEFETEYNHLITL